MSRPRPFATDDNVRAILEEATRGLRSILRGRLVGVYLYGSLVAGDFAPDISDIDLVVVMTEALDAVSFDSLHRLHQSIIERYPAWRDRLELAYISQAGLRHFRTAASTIGIISPGEPFHLIRAQDDWLISWYAVRADGVALIGPPIQSLVDPISIDEYLKAVSEHIHHYRSSVAKPQGKSALAYIILTVARGVYTLAHCQPASKVKAAAWASGRYPQWSPLIERAMCWRANPQSDQLRADQIQPDAAAFVEFMLSEIPEFD